MFFTVTNVIDGATVSVSPEWKAGIYSGDKVSVRGFYSVFYKRFFDTLAEQDENKIANELAKQRLKRLLMNKAVQLGTGGIHPQNLVNNDGNIECIVYLNDIDISKYFPDFKIKK